MGAVLYYPYNMIIPERSVPVIFILVFACTGSPALLHAQDILPVATHSESIDLYFKYQIEHGDTLNNISTLEGPFARRAFAELVIISKAFEAVGHNVKIAFLETPNVERARNYISTGKVVMSSETYFSFVFTDDVYMSSEVLPDDAFVKGIYGLEGNLELHSAKTLDDLTELSAVCVEHWKIDWKTLNALELAEVVPVSNYDLVFNMIGRRGIDFAIMEVPPFSRNKY